MVSSPALRVLKLGKRGLNEKDARVNLFARIKSFLPEVRAELRKVTWTSRKELIESTIVVVIAVIIIAAFLGMVDFFMQALVLGGRFGILELLTR